MATNATLVLAPSSPDFMWAAALCSVTAVEAVALLAAWLVGASSWEPVWVVAVELVSHSTKLLAEEHQPEIVGLTLANGRVVPWARYVAWLATCPVVLMFLVAMSTAAANARVKVKPIPLLVSSAASLTCSSSSTPAPSPPCIP